MAKGKKFDAAQKHFEGKRIEYEKRLKHLNAHVSEQDRIISEMKEQIDALSLENQQLKEWNERLLKYTELSKEDIKTACAKDKKMENLVSIINDFASGKPIATYQRRKPI